MTYNEVADVLDELRTATRHLNPDANTKSFDLDHIEKAVAERETSVARLRQLTLQHPEAFTLQDLEELQRILAEGKRAAENLMDVRRHGWTTATELRKKDFVLKTFLRFGS
jgi:hypothetical protein